MLTKVVYANVSWRQRKNITMKYWKIIKIPFLTSRTVINKLVYEGKKITNKQEKSDTMNNYFCDNNVRLHSELRDYGNRFLDYLPPRINYSFYLAPTCKDDVLFEIKKMKSMKAPGHDSIGTKIIHLCPEIFAENLSKLFNNSISQGVYPNVMRMAKVIALFKRGIKASRLACFPILTRYLKKSYARDS